ncbi:MAG: MBOAT family protein, partial [Spirochaetia bacterium]
MVFSTTIFLFLFLPLFLTGYYILPFRFRSGWILLGSWIFYSWWRVDFLALLVGTTVWTYLLGRTVSRRSQSPLHARTALIAGIVLNIGSLAYFKYFNFAVDSVNAVLSTAGAETLSVWNVILPIGISFYVFQATSYLIDVYRGDAPPARSYTDLAAYIALFPQLIAGPILRYKDLAEQFHQRNHNFDKFSDGARRFMTGFCKKVLIADTVAVIADSAFALEQPGLVGAWLGTLAYTSQLYFDFTGYSDMAIGLGLMMGFRFMENFNYPYISPSITEFWRRWHISLSSWLRDYLYIPLGGNRLSTAKTYRNILLVMLLGGLWHGAAWTFVIWGLWHGALLMSERFFARSAKTADSVSLAGSAGSPGLSGSPASTGGKGERLRLWALQASALPRTFFLVMLGWIIFRAPDMATAGRMYAGLFGFHGLGQFEMLQVEAGLLSPAVLIVSLVLIFYIPRFSLEPEVMTGKMEYLRLLIIPLFFLGILKLAAESFSPFLYFQF